MASEDLPANGHGGPADPVTKPELRRALRRVRAAFVAGLAPGERVRLETALADILAANLGPGRVAGYRAYGGEIDPGRLSRAFAWPRVTGGALSFHAGDAENLVRGYAGILEPAPGWPEVDPDIILVPLVGVDRIGNRLGQGAGHYDRTLAAPRARRAVVAVGLAWDVQLVDALPADPWDAQLGALATPSQWLTFAPARPTSAR